MGYTPATAVADLVDNSISAGATHVEVVFEWGETPAVRVIDNGHGMRPADLREAMRLGRDPRVPRDATELGRFGLGLKTASLSQAATLTVVSKAAGVEPHAAQWDLDRMEAANAWQLVDGAPDDLGCEGVLPADFASGTAVVWSHLDRMSPAGDVDTFLTVADLVSRHLGMTFHRYLEGGRLTLTVNGVRVPIWNPLPDEYCETTGTTELATGVQVRGCILRSPDTLSDGEARRLAGPLDWLEQQGFYVYRQDRLLIAGGWLGLGRGDRAWRLDRKYNLARLSLDLGNDADADWSVDVRKTTANPPDELRGALVRFADRVRRRASGRVRRAAQASPTAGGLDLEAIELWSAGSSTGIQYRVNRRHPLVSRVRRSLDDPTPLRALLDALERKAPIHAARGPMIAPDAVSVARRAQESADLQRLVLTLYPNFRRVGLSSAEARARLLESLSMQEHHDLINDIVDRLERDGEADA
jgi:hypothetical protein